MLVALLCFPDRRGVPDWELLCRRWEGEDIVTWVDAMMGLVLQNSSSVTPCFLIGSYYVMQVGGSRSFGG